MIVPIPLNTQISSKTA